MEFLRRRRAADRRAALDHRDLQARGGEIGRGDKAVVAAADDDDVALFHLSGAGALRARDDRSH